MELFIRLKDGQPFEHPILGDNFRAAFPEVDVNSLPPEFSRFERIAPPPIGVYEVYEGVTYERNGDVFTDVHHVRVMTEDEILAKQDTTKKAWSALDGAFPSWVFNAEKCSFEAPVPYPSDGSWIWDEPTLSWVPVIQSENNMVNS